MKNKHGPSCWKLIKNISNQMYKCNRKYFTTKDALNNKLYLQYLLESGIIYKHNNIPRYAFTYDSLSNYIIVRPLLNILKDKKDFEIIKIINSKVKKFPDLKEYIFYVLIDKFGDDVEKIIKIIKACGFNDLLNTEILSNISFANNDIIQKYQKHIDTNKIQPHDVILLGGLPERLLNCENYLVQTIFERKLNILKIEDPYIERRLIIRLKFNLNCINGNFLNTDNINEYLNFAFACLYIFNDDIKVLALKTIYDIIENVNSAKINDVINFYHKSNSKYAKSNIMHMLLYVSDKNKQSVQSIYNTIRDNYDFTNFDIIKDFCSIEDQENDFIKFSKKNLYKCFNNKANIKEYKVDPEYQKFFNQIRYMKYSKWLQIEPYDDEKSNLELLDVSKFKIHKVNSLFRKEFIKIKQCRCELDIDENKYKNKFNSLLNSNNIKRKILNQRNIFYAFYKYFKSLVYEYGITNREVEKYSVPYDKKYARDSALLLELFKFAENNFAGSLFCNYYCSDKLQGIYYNNSCNTVNCGMPVKVVYKDEIHKYNYNSPIMNNEEDIKTLNKLMFDRLEKLDVNKDNNKWICDYKQARNNIIQLLKPYEYKGEKWVLLSARICNGKFKDFMDVTNHECIQIRFACNFKKNINGNLNSDSVLNDKDYYKSLIDYSKYNYDFCSCISNFSGDKYLTGQTGLILPPPSVVKFLNLQYCHRTSSWKNNHAEKIILCNNNDYSYNDGVYYSCFIKLKEFKRICIKVDGFYYAFCRRYGTINNENAVFNNYIIKNNKIKKENNNNSHCVDKYKFNIKCLFCKFYKDYKKRERYYRSKKFTNAVDEFYKKLSDMIK